jgi:hypothetical protein
MVNDMPGDPVECRKHAVRCAQLADQANTEPLKPHFIGLSKTWESLARELERTQSLLALVSDDTTPPASAGSSNPQEPAQHHQSPTTDP